MLITEVVIWYIRAHHIPCHFLDLSILMSKWQGLTCWEILEIDHTKNTVTLYHCMASQLLSYYTDAIMCVWSWWHWYNKYRQSITSGMWGQMSQSNASSDSPYFLFPPLTTFFMDVNAILVFSIHDVTQKNIRERATSCLEYLCRMITCFDNYANPNPKFPPW